MRTSLLSTLLLAGTLFAAERMNVSVCNLSQLSEASVKRAEEATAAVYRSAGVEIEWKPCGENTAAGPSGQAWLIVRLRNDKPPLAVGATSLDAMGRAFLGETGHAYLADAYWQTTRNLAARHDADPDALLGLVIAHELGHLLLGEGHVPDGVMRAQWGGAEVKALERRWLQFNPAQRERIRQELRRRAELV
jgi:hypothetical protein